MTTLTIGQTYLLRFPISNYSAILKLLETHTATERYHIIFTFEDSTGHTVKFTKGAFNTMKICEWYVAPPAAPPLSNFMSPPPPIYRMPLPSEMKTFKDIDDDEPIPPPPSMPRRESYYRLPQPQFRHSDIDDLYS